MSRHFNHSVRLGLPGEESISKTGHIKYTYMYDVHVQIETEVGIVNEMQEF
jgi:hypothetical protein